MTLQILILIFGFALLISGADFLVKGASGIAKKFHISEVLIGLTIVALGTSLPELVVTVISATTGSTDIIIGNVIGSNLCNLLLILGILAILKPIKFEASIVKRNLPLLNVISLLVLMMGIGIFPNSKLVLTNLDGAILFIIAILYFVYPIIVHIKEQKKENTKQLNKKEENSPDSNVIQYVIYVLLGGFALKYGGDFVVDSVTNIAQAFAVPERIVSLTIVAFGTSLPELVTCIVAILKGDNEMAEGNIIGSCIINFCLILGVGSLISNLTLSVEYIENLVLLFISAFIIWLYGLGNKDHILTRGNGAILLVIYCIYMVKLFI